MRETYLDFICLFQYQLVLLLQEILGCITTPLLLLFALPRRAPQVNPNRNPNRNPNPNSNPNPNPNPKP